MKRYDKLVHQKIGLRINPLVDTGSPSDLTVSQFSSKFGVPISLEEDIIQAFSDSSNLSCLHIHVGSQVRDYSSMVTAIKKIHDLAVKINRITGRKQIDTLDIGGGFPVDYGAKKISTLRQLKRNIDEAIPMLFDEFNIITEFGRWPNAHSLWLLTDIEYVLDYANPKILMVHVGAEMFLREVYSKTKEQHRKFIMDGQSLLIKKVEETENYQIAGPLCFGGDFITKNIELPKTNPSDKLIICDIGANTFSLWSRHCSRSFPKIIAYQGENIWVAKQRESVSDIIKFWS